MGIVIVSLAPPSSHQADHFHSLLKGVERKKKRKEMESAPRLLPLLGGLLLLLQLGLLPGCQAKPSSFPVLEGLAERFGGMTQPGAMSGLEGVLGGQGDPSAMVGQVLAALVGWMERKEWTAEESKILESLNKTPDYEVCELECVQKEIEKTGVDTMLAQLDPLPLMAALSNPQQQQQILDPVLDKVVGSALAVTQACRPTTSVCFQCMKACINSGGGKVAVASLTIFVPLTFTFIMF